MADKYIANNAGLLSEVEAIDTSAGAGDAGKIPALDAAGRLDNSMMPVGIGTDTAVIQASENLAAGDFVNVHNSGGARVRKADASNGREAHGFVLDSVTSGNNATVYFEGQNTGVLSATPGVVYLSTTAGGFTDTAPSTAGQTVQRIGVAVSSTAINFEATQPILLA